MMALVVKVDRPIALILPHRLAAALLHIRPIDVHEIAKLLFISREEHLQGVQGKVTKLAQFRAKVLGAVKHHVAVIHHHALQEPPPPLRTRESQK